MSDPTPQPRVRRDVQSLMAEGDAGLKVLEDYARGVAAMRALDPPDDEPPDADEPRSWRFQAAIHGIDGLEPTVTDPRHWWSCRHFSWFFLPWHRLYLYCFERIIQSHIGDDTWSLPYWDYTKTDDADARLLPEPFRTPTEDNPLWTDRRDRRVNDPGRPRPVPANQASALDALDWSNFTIAGEDVGHSFAGAMAQDLQPLANVPGALESLPHGTVHTFVGGTSAGWMFRLETAALDPIFWLHHANIDRLWEVWRGVWPDSELPHERAWTQTEFELFDGDGSRITKPIADLVETTALGYAYESTDPPAAPADRRGLAPAFATPGGPDMPQPQLVGAASGRPLAKRATVGVDLAAGDDRRGLLAGTEEEPARWLLRVEDITGDDPAAPAYDVFLNLPEGAAPGDHPERRAGSFSAFGIAAASRAGAPDGGNGLTHVFDVTPVVGALREAGAWDPAKVAVTIIPVELEGEAPDGGDVTPGRISVYAG